MGGSSPNSAPLPSFSNIQPWNGQGGLQGMSDWATQSRQLTSQDLNNWGQQIQSWEQQQQQNAPQAFQNGNQLTNSVGNQSVPGTQNATSAAIGATLPPGMQGLGGIPTQFTPQVSAAGTFTPPSTVQTSAGNQPLQGSLNLFSGFNQPGNSQLPANAQNLIQQLLMGIQG